MKVLNEKKSQDNPIDLHATEWVAKLDSGAVDLDSADLNAWLDADERHRGAFYRALASWKNFDRLSVLRHAPMVSHPSETKRRGWIAAAAAAFAVCAAAAVLFFAVIPGSYKRFQTPVGGFERITLEDGSSIDINTNSILRAAMGPDVRSVDIAQGEAWFHVAKDKNRPFIVSVGDVRVRAVGTAFSVRQQDQGANLLVTEGVVETWSVNDPKHVERITAGTSIFVSALSGPSTKITSAKTMNQLLAWRQGEIALNGQTLKTAADEFNRYNEVKITVDPSLADKRFVGWFRANEPGNFAYAAAASVGARVVTGKQELRLVPKP